VILQRENPDWKGAIMKAGKQSRRDLLKQVPLFSNLSKKNLENIEKIAEKLEVQAGKVLVRQGALGLEFVLILEGGARIERDAKVVNHLSANSFFGEIALLDRKPRAAIVVAETDMKL
jgi:CRP-like cAMP-binding protein